MKILDEVACSRPLSQPGKSNLRSQLLAWLIKRVQESDKIPSALLAEGVVTLSDGPVDCGSFSDIYQGRLRGRCVALKQVRMARNDTPRDKKSKRDVS